MKNFRDVRNIFNMNQGGAAVARVAHNHEAAGSNPAPGINKEGRIEFRNVHNDRETLV